MADENADHPVARTRAPARDFFIVPIDLAPPQIQQVLPSLFATLDLVGGDSWIAGGAIRDALLGQKPKDTDVYFETAADFEAALKRLEGRGAKVTKRYPLVTQFELPNGEQIDLVYRIFDGVVDTLRCFDFVACCGAISRTAFAYHRSFAQQARAGVLRFNACPNAYQTVKRIERFVARGWTICPGDVERCQARAQQSKNEGSWSSGDDHDEDDDLPL